MVNLPDMMRYTGDAPGDVCAHARSCFIQVRCWPAGLLACCYDYRMNVFSFPPLFCCLPACCQLVSKVTLQTFMDTFNEIARAAHSNDDNFYTQVGGVGCRVFAYIKFVSGL